MTRQFGERARFVSENYGDSELARRFGVTRYPAIFVDDVLVATPKDFGFFGKGEGKDEARYAPLRSAEAHERFRSDLARMISLILSGRSDLARAAASPAKSEGIAQLPPFQFQDLDGKPRAREAFAGKVVLVEFWATWCPPCRGTLRSLGELKKRYGEDLQVIALAVESDEEGVRKLTTELALPVVWGMGTAELALQFGDLSAVPTLLLFDRDGRSAGTFFGAPPSLHQEVAARIDALLARP